MRNIKDVFSIKNLEDISGINSHSIRMWERRYNLFEPSRSIGNTRHYDLKSLQKLLNISLLKKEGYKISKIAALSDSEILTITQNIVDKASKQDKTIAQLKIAMYSFNATLFEQSYQEALLTRSFEEVFKNIFLPFLNFLGLYWQTNTITIAHEHFISNLIIQKIQLNIALLNVPSTPNSTLTYILFLPEEEMHEIGLLYLHYILLSRGHHSIYLGRSVPLKDLATLKSLYSKIIWVGNFIILPNNNKLNSYFKEVEKVLLGNTHQFWAVGSSLSEYALGNNIPNLHIFSSLKEILNKI